ncbi:MAG TPA: NAD-dependent epimerase/dehydratase family protein [Chthoniobacterales bacterium]|jgi:UDP-glucose 4-epimerase|nr:NAD-dependent epimerase/dehydratase family protein [Chthoniobacterales bacterium]
MAHYLITGGAGFIGSHLVDRLLQAGHRVTVIDDFSTGKAENLPCAGALDIVPADLLTVAADRLAGPFAAVVHLAALASVNDSWGQLGRAHARNLTATVRVIELARELGTPRLVFASSAAVYGHPETVPIAEDHPRRPVSPYGLQKVASEEYGRLFARDDFSFVALRFFNVFGPRQVADSPYSGVITKFAGALRANQPVTIFGDGTQTRDFVYVQDIAAGISRALEAPDLAPFTVCNLGCGRAVSILQLAEMMREFFPHWQSAVERAPMPPGDIVRSEADISAAQRLLDYRPQYSLTSGLAEMFDELA